jgi:hypothetical protein
MRWCLSAYYAFTARVAHQVPQLELDLPWSALGSSYAQLSE